MKRTRRISPFLLTRNVHFFSHFRVLEFILLKKTLECAYVISRECLRIDFQLHEEWEDLLFVKCAKKRSRMMDKTDFIVHLCPERRRKVFGSEEGLEKTHKKSNAVNVCVKVKSWIFSLHFCRRVRFYRLFEKMISRFFRFVLLSTPTSRNNNTRRGWFLLTFSTPFLHNKQKFSL